MNANSPPDLIHRVEYDDREDLAFTVIDAVARASGLPHAEIGPLNDVLDPEALCDLFGPRADGQRRTGGTVSFGFEGYQVTIDAVEREVLVYG
ncbi:HalOD1 output domain-containing protein [Halalkalicoccus jeotgali]|uniref:Halobacterial output domain-containing protein n=1 Tax=Halalkalicoccus jeotgali (strain DSM 18796 / CECT 7217 / JCM 14584 / KCTC 4019 / B3) TaxID=795797 RepID=D8J8A6_HALJB|nr:HalOD1 output domain-containing protein [Halalkalicoccus jeotgali]ADJ16152.1 hypothetical protein HacjB3_13855 [Halalkalicoccus jeotgali B3]ELY37581.1 hypothetical protein C497_09068 [Halalkalicoccus jeotgali B3]